MAKQAQAKSIPKVAFDRATQKAVFEKHLGNFLHPRGSHLIERTRPLGEWIDQRSTLETWPYSRALATAPSAMTRLTGQNGSIVEGINFGSQDYLGLSSHPEIHMAVLEALREYGPHTASSPMLQGNTLVSRKLEHSLAELLDTRHVMLFPTGWAAGFGSIAGLVGPNDYVVIDQLAHACLTQGAKAATRKHFSFAHNDTESVRERLDAIRAKDAANSILVVTEGVFSMDSDSPDIFKLQGICREFEAVLMVDVAHDLGASGPSGAGQIGLQNMLGEVDLIVGSFSKCFASNGGFLATHDRSVKQFLSVYGGPYIFSNALSPLQAAIVMEALRIVRSDEGEALRDRSLQNINHLRDSFSQRGVLCLGRPTNVVPVIVGDETLAKWTSRFLEGSGLLANLVEFPAVPKGTARFRFQVMATHTSDQIDDAVTIFCEASEAAREMTDCD